MERHILRVGRDDRGRRPTNSQADNHRHTGSRVMPWFTVTGTMRSTVLCQAQIEVEAEDEEAAIALAMDEENDGSLEWGYQELWADPQSWSAEQFTPKAE